MSEKLKPCPFCGGEARVYLNFVPTSDGLDEVNQYECGCERCGIAFYGLWERDRVVNEWNRRS